MKPVNHYDSFTEAWLRTGNQLGQQGTAVSPRKIKTFEFIGHQISFPMRTAVLRCPARKLGYQFMYREAWWILAGRNDLQPLEEVCRPMVAFSDDGIHLSGAYGPKVVDQLSYIKETLITDQFSRQAVINVWRERPGFSKDIPCTLSFQFILRTDVLHAIVTMRSSDIWLGLPYDVFAVTMIATYLACALSRHYKREIRLGNMHHTAGSRHIYQKDLPGMMRCLTHEEFARSMSLVTKDLIDAQQIHRAHGNNIDLYYVICNMLYKASDKVNSPFGFLNHAASTV